VRKKHNFLGTFLQINCAFFYGIETSRLTLFHAPFAGPIIEAFA
jgi:hypothetical protein